MIKNFVLDTNVLIHDPEAIFKFDEHNVHIPIYVVEEVDKFKREGTERGRNCRHFCRLLDELRGPSGHLAQGVSLGDGKGKLTVFVPKAHSPNRTDHGAMDSAILLSGIEIRDRNKRTKTIFVTMDTNLRIRADVLGLDAQIYENSQTESDVASSVAEVDVSKDDVDDFFRYGRSVIGIPKGVRPNASVLLRDLAQPSHTALSRYDAEKQELMQLKTPKEGVMGIRPKNKEQAFALDLLLDDRIQLVTLVGKAGTGKTLIALAAGLMRIEEGAYTRMLVSRPVMPLGKDIGFLPGSVDEKLNPWMQPIFDNLEFLFTKDKDKDKDKDKKSGSASYADLLDSGVVQVEPLTYIRGRSLPYQYIIVDEAQNLTPHEIKTIITRAGEGSKIVLTGDPEQIDNPYVDAASNGLSVVADRFRDQKVAGHVVLTKGERSHLAELAANLL